MVMEWIRFLHVLGAIAAGYYMLLPFFAGRLASYSSTVQVGFLRGLFLFNRVGQYILIAQFITGGYLISKKPYHVVWIVLVIVIFIIVGALAGMMARPMKRMRADLESGRKEGNHLQKIKVYSWLIAIGVLVLIIMMVFPVYR